MKKITFVLPGGTTNPVGGYKVVYEYANRLFKDGYQVNIVFPATLLWKERPLTSKVKGILRYIYFKYNKKYYFPYNWFTLNKKIKLFWVPTLEEKYIPDSDYIFATACQTAEYVMKYDARKGKKYYLIQSYENWGMNEERLLNTWKAPMQKIVISKYLEKKAEELNQNSVYIENGLNFNEFYIEKDIAKEENTIMMLYHSDEKVKQSKMALDKIKELKEKNKKLKLILFGVSKKPKNLPEWIEYYQKPERKKLRELYNKSILFISPSKIEGWALPPAESMQCGTCVCVTDIAGHEYVKHLETGYRINEDLSNLVNSVEYLLMNRELTNKLAKSGNKFIQKFTWERAYFKLKNTLENY